MLNNANGFIIVTALILAVSLAIFIGSKLGAKRAAVYTDQVKSHIIRVQSSILGLLSFLIGFTFSIAIHHYDERNIAMKEEANAIGTTYLRAHSLPDTVKSETISTLGKYIDARVMAGGIPLNQTQLMDLHLREAGRLRGELWTLAMKSIKEDDRITTTGLYIQALNNLIDSYGTRDEVLNRHIPSLVIFLLVCSIILSSALIGYTSAIYNHRPSKIAVLYLFIIAVLTYVLIDLDRPRRGVIQVSQKNMLDIQMEIKGLSTLLQSSR